MKELWFPVQLLLNMCRDDLGAWAQFFHDWHNPSIPGKHLEYKHTNTHTHRGTIHLFPKGNDATVTEVWNGFFGKQKCRSSTGALLGCLTHTGCEGKKMLLKLGTSQGGRGECASWQVIKSSLPFTLCTWIWHTSTPGWGIWSRIIMHIEVALPRAIWAYIFVAKWDSC